MNAHRATVSWIGPNEGGRSSLPNGTRYATIARFADDGPDWPDGAWTVVLDFEQSPFEAGSPTVGTAQFLMDTAPHGKLKSGVAFELYEGLRKVAIVDIS